MEMVVISLPEDLPNPGIKPKSPVSPELAGRFFTTEPPGMPWEEVTYMYLPEYSSDF